MSHHDLDEERLVAALGELPREEAPSHDLWPGIAARLDRPALAPVVPLAPRARPRLPAARGLALAASIAAAVLGVGRLAATLETRSEDARRPAPLAALEPALERTHGPVKAERALTTTEAAARRDVAFVAFVPSEDAYRAAAAELLTALEARRGTLRPETLAVIEANLKIIDESIARVRAALAADPGSADLTFLLSSAYQAKLDLLRQVTRLPDRT